MTEAQTKSFDNLKNLLSEGSTIYVNQVEQNARTGRRWFRVFTVHTSKELQSSRIVDITVSTATVLEMRTKETPNAFWLYPGNIGYSVKQYIGEELQRVLGIKLQSETL